MVETGPTSALFNSFYSENFTRCLYARGKVKRELDNESPLRHLKRRGPGTALCASTSRKGTMQCIAETFQGGNQVRDAFKNLLADFAR